MLVVNDIYDIYDNHIITNRIYDIYDIHVIDVNVVNSFLTL
jgi:hypothetical protein